MSVVGRGMSRVSNRVLWMTVIICAISVLALWNAPDAGAAWTNDECAACHGAGSLNEDALFDAAGVNRETACRKCHLDSLVGSHPNHYAGGDCSSVCHRSWGPSLSTAVPTHLSPGGAFASSTSNNAPSWQLHTIHLNPRWPAQITTAVSKCGSCHATAACSACHDGNPAPYDPVHAPTHELHASHISTITPWVGDVSPGVFSSQSEDTLLTGQSVRCGAVGCHDITGTAEGAPFLKDSYNHGTLAGGYVATTVVKTGTWKEAASTVYSLGRMAYSNYVNSTLTMTFTGERITVVSDQDPYRGIMEVSIDGTVVASVDQYSATTRYQRPVWTSNSLGEGEHTITFRVTGTRNPAARATWISFDQLRVYADAKDSIAPECGSCHPLQTIDEGPDAHGSGIGAGTFSHDMTQTIVSTNPWTTGYGEYSCDQCHMTKMIDEHQREDASGWGKGKCSICHPSEAPSAWSGTMDLANGCSYGTAGVCHTAGSGRDRHGSFAAIHQVPLSGQTVACAACHSSDLRIPHINSVPGNGHVEEDGCLTCHNTLDIASATACTASGCHAATFNAMDAHTIKDAASHTASEVAKPFNRAYQGDVTLDDGGKECDTCHTGQLFSAHSDSPAVGCSSGGNGGLGCHLDTSLDSIAIAASGWTSRRCIQCHNYGSNASHENTTTAHVVANNGCAGSGSGCHNSNDLWQLHAASQSGGAPAAQSCANVGCHDTLDRRPLIYTANSCGAASGGLGCHPTYTIDHAANFQHSFTTASQYNKYTESGCTSQDGCHAVGGTSTSDFGQPFHPNSGCSGSVCHQSVSKPAFTGLLPTDCQECHTASGGFTGSPARMNLTAAPAAGGHYASAVHSATGLDATLNAGGSANAACSDCHDPAVGGSSPGLYNQHRTITLGASPYGATLECGECHGDTRVGGKAQVESNWTAKTCAACHTGGTTSPLDHATTVPAANESGSSCGNTGTGCHASVNLHQIHRNASGGCALLGCHDFAQQAAVPTAKSCGQTSGVCHTNKTSGNHGADHGYTTASDHDESAMTGCTNSGAGCHGTPTLDRNAIEEYHQATKAGCTATDKCHSSSTMDVAWKTANSGAECVACHAGNFVNAPDTIALTDVSPAGHYSETTHTATGMGTTVSAGGTYSATCSTCHNPTNASGIDGLFNQHQGLTGGLNITCSGCHNKNAAIQGIVTDATRTNTCVACHTGAVLPTMVQHGTTAPVVTGTEMVSGSCVTAGCHATTDLHVLHRSDNTGGPNGCTVTGCHDATKQGAKPTAVSCGAGGSCHTGDSHAPTAHQTLASAACVACHEWSDLRLAHGDNCSTCHGNPTYPALPTGKLECTSCHNGTDVGLHVYDPYDPNHYMAANHTASGTEGGISNTGGKTCVTCHSLEMKPEHWKSTTDTSTLSAYADACVGCHEVKVDNLTVTPWTSECQACHAPAAVHTAYATDHDFTVGNGACAGANCHNIADVTVVHAVGLPGAGDCTSCHASNLVVPTQTLCSDCHAAHPAQATVHTTAQTDCTSVCHSSKADISTGHASCATCHANATLVDYLKNNYTSTCTDCHNTSLIGLKTYSPYDPNHYGLIIHSASPFTFVYQSTGADGTVPSETKECGNCHTAALKTAHANTSTSGGSVTCTECHGDTSLNSAAVVAGNWPTDRCTDCHDYGAARTHDGMAAIHVVSTARGCAGSGASCHNHTDLAKMHNVSQSGGTPKYLTCANTGCHVTKDARPVATYASDSCGDGSTGCHTDKTTTNHGGKHTLNVTGSNYNNTTVSGCTNSGAGCHGFNASTSITVYHPDSGCTEGPCHTSISKPSKTEPFICQNCHDGTYVNAIDTVGLTDGAPSGHYSETTHTVGSMDATVGAGGTYSAPCSTCHNPISAGSINGLYVQHQNLNFGLGDTTCSDCHNYNAAIQTIVTDANRDNTCPACHNATVLPTMPMHGGTAPAVNGSEAGGAGTCVGAGCHATLDLHALHKSDASGNPNGCTMSGCHDPNVQGHKPTPNSCGVSGDCHTTDPHSPLSHITAASAACVVCHESTDLRVVHKQTCAHCHDNPTYPTLPAGKLECLSCHVPGTVGTKTYTPVDPNHYLGTETTHTASGAQGSDTYSGFACTTCHLMEMKPEHDKSTAAFPTVPGTHANKCIACHELRVDGFTLSWTEQCSACHTVKHADLATKHNATAVGGTCATTINTVEVARENFDSVTAPAWPATGWTRSNTAGKVVTNATQRVSLPNSGAFVNTAGTTEYFERTFDLSGYTNARITFWRYTAGLDATVDFLRAAYSTNGGTNWTDIYPASNANVAGGIIGPVSLPSVPNVLVRFSGANNQANETIYIDDIVIAGDVGTICHDVTDVAAIHNDSVPHVSQADTDLCTTCHTTNTAVPTILTCVDASCHAGIHNVDHTVVGSPECLSCHSATNDVRVIHAGKGDGCDVCHGGGGYTDVHNGKTAECAQSGCHIDETPVNATHYVGTETSHTAGASQTNSTLGAWALSPTCVTCHDATLLSEHDAATAAKTTVPGNVCENCHLSTALPNSPTVVAGDWAARGTVNACIACHAIDTVTVMHGQTALEGNHAVTNDTQSCASSGVGCHPVANVARVGTPTTSNNIHLACASCHGKSAPSHLVIPGALAQGCTGNVGCHSTGYSTNQHTILTGDEAVHTASGMATSLDPSYTNYDACQNCHSATLGLAHKDTSTTANLGTGRTAWNSTAQSTCRDCHNAPATTGYAASGTVVKGNWATKTCEECHTAKHGNYTVARHEAPGSSGCTLSGGCHGYTGATLDVRVLHDKASSGCTASGTDGKNWTGGCHALDKQMSTANMSCGSGAVGQACHTNHTHLNHGPDHTYTTASDYTQAAETVGSEAGCAGSGAGCHGTITAERDAINDFHDADTKAGCASTDKCHGSSTMTQAWKDGATRADCVRCHNNNFVGAPDRMPLFEAASAGHYSETTHTASGMGTSVGAGGSAAAACTVCHSSTYRNAHGAAGGGFSSTTKGTYVTCTECHGYNAAVTTFVTDTTRTDTCAACHTAGVLGAARVAHGTAAPTALSTSVACGSTGIGCHNTLDLHTIHRNASGGCVLSGCHALNKDMSSASKACGEATGCHLNTLYAPTAHNGTGGLADGYDSDHHTAGATQMGATYSYNGKNTACSACHSGSLGIEHTRATSALTGAGATVCLKCHNDSATVANIVNTSWPGKNTTSACAACHAGPDNATAAAQAHTNVGTHSTGTAVTGCSDKGVGCHGVGPTVDLTTVHYSGCALTRACHSTTVYNAGVKTCTSAACHPSTDYVASTFAHKTVNGTDETHTVTPVSMSTTLSAGGLTSSSCASCHSMTLKGSHNAAVGYASNSLGAPWTSTNGECLGCHNATSPVVVKNIALARNWGGTCLSNGCHNTTQSAHVDGGTDTPAALGSEADGAATCATTGCHATLDLHELHKGDGVMPEPSCATLDCHDVAHIDKRPTKKSCGNLGECHTVDPHNPLVHTTVASGGCVICHESPVLQVVHENNCGYCHGNPAYPTLPTGKLECVSCHVSGTVGSKTYTPVETNHYVGTEVTHTASAQTGNVGGYACSQCHKTELKPEHIVKVSSSFSTTTTAIGKCVVCHEEEVDNLPILPWDKTCVACHAVNHLDKDAKHDASAVGGTCAGSAVEATVHSENFDGVTAPAWPATGWIRGGTNPAQWTTNATVSNTAPNSARFLSTANGTINTGHFDQTFNMSGYTNPQISFFYSISGSGDDWLMVQYSTNAGGSWTNILAQTTASVGMMQVGPVPIPNVANVLVRFTAWSNRTNNIIYVDTIRMTGLTGSSCHEVADVSVIHNNSVPAATTADTLTCRVCHDGNDAVPTVLTCADSSCHAGVHVADHLATSSPECLSCHSATNDTQIIHAGVGDGCNVCHGGGGYTDIHTGKTAECAQSGCHAAETPVNPNHYTGTETSHTAGATQTNSTLGAWALSPTCITCHDATLLSEHSEATAVKSTVPANVCENCHLSTALPNSPTVVAGDWAARGTANACIACHAVDTVTNMHGQISITGNHAVTNDTQSCASSGVGCHPVANVAQVGTPSTSANIHITCGSCHDKSSSAHLTIPGALAQGCTGNAACHTVGFSTNNHGFANGDEEWHTAASMTTALGAYTYSNTCQNCHSATLGLAHKDTSTTANLGTGRTAWNLTAQSTCRDCHNAPATTGYAASGTVVKGNWTTKTCEECHTAKHGTFTLARHQAPAGSGCTLTGGCHGYTGTALDVRVLHDRASSGCTASGTDGKNWTGGCHALDKQMSTANMSCGSGATGQACHINHTHLNHGPDHTYTVASDYSQTLDGIGSEAGCSNSGAACHGTAGVDRDAIQEFHGTKTAGCTSTDKCHGSPTMSQAWKDGGSGNDCIRCHNNNFVNARDTMPLFEASSAGHYGETTHTATAGLGNVAAGGTASAPCSTCHDLVLRNAHGANGGPFSSKTKGVYVTCQECHAYNAAASNVVTTNWTARSCAACHTSGVLGATQAMHTSTAPVVTGSSTAGCGAQGAGCHNTYDLHALHRNAPGGCTLTGCHAKNKDMTTTAKACGGATGCHLSSTYTNTLHNGLNGDDLTKHRAQSDESSSLAGYVKPTTCTLCHTSTLKTAHNTTPSWTTPYCLNCHNATSPVNSVNVIKNTAWNNGSCAACHTVKHGAMTILHDASVEGISCAPSGGESVPTTVDLHRENFDSVTAPAFPSTWTKGGTSQALLVTTNSTSVSAPNSARFASDNTSAKSAYLEKSFNLAASDTPLLSFRYSTSYAVSSGNVVVKADALTGDQANWELVNAADKVAAIATSDTAHIYNKARNSTAEILYSLADVNTSWTIDSVTMYVYSSDENNRGLTGNVRVGGNVLDSIVVPGSASGAYTLNSKLLTAPVGGWTPADLNGMTLGLRPTTAVNNTALGVRVDSVWFEVAYSAPSANNYLMAQYSTNGGGSWTPLLNQTTSVGWTLSSSTGLPQQDNVLVRFTMSSDSPSSVSYLDDIVITHVVLVGGGGGEGCHDVTDVSLIHDTATGPGCVACHTAPEVLPITKTCSAVGCHATGADHDALHQVTTASNYADGSGEGNEAGCLNSGSGCHATTILPANAAKTLHPASGCLDGACHLSASMTSAWKTSGEGMECVRCHNGTFAGATDKVALYDFTPAGHYGETSHTASAGLGNVAAGGTASAACGTCHDLGMRLAHSGAGFSSKSKGAKVTCGECHNYNVATTSIISTNWSTRRCDACHASGVLGATQVMHNATTAPVTTGSSTAGCGASGAGCHSTYDLHALHRNATSGCTLAGCHDAKNKDMTTAAKTCGQATGCHTSATYNTTLHGTLTGADTTKHRASGNASASLGGYTQSTSCTNCHSLTMRPAHDTRAGWTWPYCTSCHNQTTPINSVNIIKNTAWNNGTCEACHTAKHNTFGNHTATQSSGCTIGTCHTEGGTGTSRDVRTLHDRVTSGCSAAGTDNKLWTGACHALDKQMTTTAMSCGSGATGQACHTGHTHLNHGPDHGYTAASAYTQTADTIGSEAGCANSGTGCHVSASTGDAVTTFHSAKTAGCTATDKCHSSPTMSAAWKTGGTGADCSRCHSNNFVNARDTMPLFEALSAGHYGETSHTATAGLSTLNAGGTASAACSICHDLGLRNAHGANGGPFSSKARGVYVTCQECHGYNAATSNIITTSWTAKSCAACHTGTVLGATQVMHTTTPPVVTGTSTAGCGASGAGCHTTYELHNLHRNAPGGCTLTGCHAKNKDMTTAAKTCGQASGCHLSGTYNATSHNGLTGNDTTKHRAAGNAAASLGGYVWSTACTNCHSLTMTTAHTTKGSPWVTPFCTDCHNQTTPINSVNIIKNTAWNNGTCEACHTAKHNTFGNHTSNQSSGCTLGTCHSAGGAGTSRDVRLLHTATNGGCSSSGTDSMGWVGTNACHQLNKQMNTTTMSCGNGATGQACHTNHTHSNHGTGGGPCFGCHGASSTSRLDKMVNDTSVYHHVLDAAVPDQQANLTSTSVLGCRSCHVDHQFTTKAANLKTGIGTTVATNTDYSATTPFGICLSCHTTAVTRTSTAQKAGGNATLRAINQADYNVSMHNYEINNAAKIGFNDASAFRANCVKCHDDGAASPSVYQTGSFKVATHYSTEANLTAALGAGLAGATTLTEENVCFKCHITAGALTTDTKTTVGKDGYNEGTMSTSSEGVYTDFQKTYKHNVAGYAGIHTTGEYTAAPTSVAWGAATGWWGTSNVNKHVECADCHDPHTAGSKRPAPSYTNVRAANTAVTLSPANKGSWGVNIAGGGNTAASGLWNPTGTLGTYANPTYTKVSPATHEWQMCLKCHSVYAFGTNPPTVSFNLGNQTGGKQTDVGRDFSPTLHAYHPLFKAGRNQPLATANANWNTSTSRRMIGGTTTGHGLSNTLVDGWLSTSLVTCSDCHGSNDAAAGSSGPHGSTNKWIIKGPDLAAKVTIASGAVTTPNSSLLAADMGDYCLNCHRRDVYGKGSTYDGTQRNLSRATHGAWNSSCTGVSYTKVGLTGCMNCHGGRRDDASFNSPTNATVQSGAMHGTSVTGNLTHGGQAAAYTAEPLGLRFANGASWHTHQFARASGSQGCQTAVADTYSSCGKHNKGTTDANLNYYY